jgi:hypothetical protein
LAPRRVLASFAALVAASAAAGCQRSWSTQTTQPPLTLGSTLDARTSLPATILMGDMDVPRSLRLANSVYFVAVSRDRLRFHVTLLHKWEEIADPSGWQVWIEDDSGRRYKPEDVDRRVLRPVTQVYDRGFRGSVNTAPLYSVTVYRGDGDYVFYRRDLLRKNMRWLRLVMTRPGYEYSYVWEFFDPPDTETRVRDIVPNRLSI